MRTTIGTLAATVALTLAFGCGKKAPKDGDPPGPSDNPAGTPEPVKRTPATKEQLAEFAKKATDAGFVPYVAPGEEKDPLPVYRPANARQMDLSRFPEPPFHCGLHLAWITFPTEKIEPLAPSPKLVRLVIATEGGFRDNALPVLAKHTSVDDLRLITNGITDAGLVHLKGFPRLRRLDLTGNSITDAGLTQLATFRNLEWLDLTNNLQVTERGLLALKELRKLNYLGLGGLKAVPPGAYNFDSTDRHLALMSEIGMLHAIPEALGESGDPLVRPKSAAEVRSFTVGPGVTDAGVAHVKAFPNLTAITLGGSVTDEGLKHLHGLKKLTYVKVGSKVTETGKKQLQAALPGCKIVN